MDEGKVENKSDLQAVVTRVMQMEQYMDEVCAMLQTNPKAIKETAELRRKIAALTDYMDSGQWLQDYEADERGELPAEVKRGVLSQDALYNLLAEIREMEVRKAMSLKDRFITIRDNYVINQVKKLTLPRFEESPVRRYRITFSGRVQKVGFRLEVTELIKKLGITGTCENLENGDVVAELQGPENKVKFLVSFMESLKRIKITNKVIEELEVAEETERTNGKL